jgi:hypothetical protein
MALSSGDPFPSGTRGSINSIGMLDLCALRMEKAINDVSERRT